MKRQNLFLGGVLALLLFFAYQIWTEEASPVLNSGTFPVWQVDANQIDSLTYVFPQGRLRIEKRSDSELGEYLWGVAETSEAEIARLAALAAAMDSANVANLGDAAPDSVEAPPGNFLPSAGFLVGPEGATAMGWLANLTARREFGILDEEQKAEYGLTPDSVGILTVYYGNGTKELTIGGASYGSTDRYALDPETGRSFVLTNEVIDLFEGGSRKLQERRAHAYSPQDVRSVNFTSPQGDLDLVHVLGEYGLSSWRTATDPETANPSLDTFMQHFNALWFDDINETADRTLLTSLGRADYFGGDGRQLGFLELYRWDGPGGTPVYYIETELTRAPVQVPYIDSPQQVENEIPTLF